MVLFLSAFLALLDIIDHTRRILVAAACHAVGRVTVHRLSVADVVTRTVAVVGTYLPPAVLPRPSRVRPRTPGANDIHVTRADVPARATPRRV